MPPTPALPPPTDRDRCVCCGYDARSLSFVHDMATCPECGGGVDRTVLAELPPIRRPFIAALILPVALFALYAWRRSYRAFVDVHPDAKILIHAAATIFPPPLFFMSRNRLRWQLMPRGRRRLVLEAILFWLLCGVVITALAVNWSFVATQFGRLLRIR